MGQFGRRTSFLQASRPPADAPIATTGNWSGSLVKLCVRSSLSIHRRKAVLRVIRMIPAQQQDDRADAHSLVDACDPPDQPRVLATPNSGSGDRDATLASCTSFELTCQY